VKKLVRINTD